MLIQKKKIIIALLAMLGGITAMVCLAKSAENKPLAKPLSNTRYSLSSYDSNFPPSPSGSFSTQEMFIKMIFSVLVVVILGTAAVYASKKFLPRITNLPGKKIRIIETVHLGSHKALHLVEIGNRQFFIGSTAENITKLAEVTNISTDLSDTGTENNRE